MRPIRQGDILLVPVEPSAAKGDFEEAGSNNGWRATGNVAVVVRRKRGEGIIVASGEASGHHHRAREPRARLIRKGNKLFLQAPKGGAVLTHEEHDPIEIPHGTFEVVRQREYTPPERKSRSSRASTRMVSD